MNGKVLVTGATGYLGKRLVVQLRDIGYEVVGLTRRNSGNRIEGIEYITGDITQPIEFPSDIIIIFHCAGVIDEDDVAMIKTNVDGTRNIVNAACKLKCRLIHVSSAGVVGWPDTTEIDESTPCNPLNLYEKTKLEAEQILLQAVEKGLQAQIIRPTIIFGIRREGNKDSLFQFIQAIKDQKYFSIGNGVYNLIHIDEVVKAMIVLAETCLPSGGIWILNTPISFSLFVQTIRKLALDTERKVPSIPYGIAYLIAVILQYYSKATGRSVPLNLSRLKALTNNRVFSSARILSKTNYVPEKNVIEWIKESYVLYYEKR
nr:NAD-dependent epimerase/dehydratase family protein [uncultured Anaeromusa sp.]